MCDVAPPEIVNPLFPFPSHTFPFLDQYVRLWGWERRGKEDDFPFLFLFFLGKAREGKRINYNLPPAINIFARTFDLGYAIMYGRWSIYLPVMSILFILYKLLKNKYYQELKRK